MTTVTQHNTTDCEVSHINNRIRSLRDSRADGAFGVDPGGHQKPPSLGFVGFARGEKNLLINLSAPSHDTLPPSEPCYDDDLYDTSDVSSRSHPLNYDQDNDFDRPSASAIGSPCNGVNQGLGPRLSATFATSNTRRAIPDSQDGDNSTGVSTTREKILYQNWVQPDEDGRSPRVRGQETHEPEMEITESMSKQSLQIFSTSRTRAGKSKELSEDVAGPQVQQETSAEEIKTLDQHHSMMHVLLDTYFDNLTKEILSNTQQSKDTATNGLKPLTKSITMINQ